MKTADIQKNITPELPSIQAEDLQEPLKTASLKFLSCSKSLRLKLSLKLKKFSLSQDTCLKLSKSSLAMQHTIK